MKSIQLTTSKSLINKTYDKPIIAYVKNEDGTEKVFVIDSTIQPGDIVVCNANGQHIIIPRNEYTGTEGTPIAVVVIPKSVSKSGENVCMSLVNMDNSNPKEGSADALEGTTDAYGQATFPLIDAETGEKIADLSDVGLGGTMTADEKTLVGIESSFNYHGTGCAQKRFEFVTGECVMSQLTSVTNKTYHTFTAYDDNVIDMSTEDGYTKSGLKGYTPQTYYNSDYIWADGNTYGDNGFQDETYPKHYWYADATLESTSKFRIASPIDSNEEWNTQWDVEGTLMSDMDGKTNTQILVEKAKEGVTDPMGNILKWDGTPSKLWCAYKVPNSLQLGSSSSAGVATYKNDSKKTGTGSGVQGCALYMPWGSSSGNHLGRIWSLHACICSCFAPTNSHTNPGDWYWPAAGEVMFAATFSEEINDAISKIKKAGYNAVGISHPYAINGTTESYTQASKVEGMENEYHQQLLTTSTALTNLAFAVVYTNHASFERSTTTQSGRTRAFIHII